MQLRGGVGGVNLAGLEAPIRVRSNTLAVQKTRCSWRLVGMRVGPCIMALFCCWKGARFGGPKQTEPAISHSKAIPNTSTLSFLADAGPPPPPHHDHGGHATGLGDRGFILCQWPGVDNGGRRWWSAMNVIPARM